MRSYISAKSKKLTLTYISLKGERARCPILLPHHHHPCKDATRPSGVSVDERLSPDLSRGRGKSIGGDLDTDEECSE
jgi:hypothetical protein